MAPKKTARSGELCVSEGTGENANCAWCNDHVTVSPFALRIALDLNRELRRRGEVLIGMCNLVLCDRCNQQWRVERAALAAAEEAERIAEHHRNRERLLAEKGIGKRARTTREFD